MKEKRATAVEWIQSVGARFKSINLRYMTQFYQMYNKIMPQAVAQMDDDEILPQVVAKLNNDEISPQIVDEFKSSLPNVFYGVCGQ